MTATGPRLSLVLPCYNEADTIGWLAERFVSGMPPGLDAELMLVDNGSHDTTPQVLRELLANPRYAAARSIRVEPNRGYGFGIWSGLLAARGEFLAWSHADQQCDPQDVFRAFARLQQSARPEATIVKGQRQRRAARAMALTLGMQFAARVVLGQRLDDINGQPKVFPRGLLVVAPDPPLDFNFDLYMLSRARRAGWTIDTVPVTFGRRAHGESRWAFSLRSKARHIAGALRFMAQLRRQSSR